MGKLSDGMVWTMAGSAIISGCAIRPSTDYSALGLVDIRGQITLDDEPLPQATIRFVSPDSTYSYAVTDRKGNYRARLNSEQPGVTPGTKTVWITALPTEESSIGELEELEEFVADAASKAEDSVPAIYNTASELQIEVTESDRHLDFRLTSGA